ncbi:hypothetical protein SUDANB6_00117 [Streptomyces sp. enrichment culture]
MTTCAWAGGVGDVRAAAARPGRERDVPGAWTSVAFRRRASAVEQGCCSTGPALGAVGHRELCPTVSCTRPPGAPRPDCPRSPLVPAAAGPARPRPVAATATGIHCRCVAEWVGTGIRLRRSPGGGSWWSGASSRTPQPGTGVAAPLIPRAATGRPRPPLRDRPRALGRTRLPGTGGAREAVADADGVRVVGHTRPPYRERDADRRVVRLVRGHGVAARRFVGARAAGRHAEAAPAAFTPRRPGTVTAAGQGSLRPKTCRQ